MAKLKYKKLVQGSLNKKATKNKPSANHGLKKKPRVAHGIMAPAAPSAPSAPAASTPTTQAPSPAPAPTSAPNAPTPDAGGPTENFLNVSSFNPTSGQPDPRDSQYWADLAALQASAQQEYAGAQLEQSYANTDYTRQQGIDAENQRRNVRDTAESQIGTGLLRSGAHNRAQTEGVLDYTNLTSQRASDKSRGDAQRRAQMQAIISNLSVGEMGLYSDTTGRYSDAQAEKASSENPIADLSGEPADAGLYGLGGGKKKKKKKSSGNYNVNRAQPQKKKKKK